MEFLNSFFKSVNERLTSPLYGALLIATIMWNYDIFLTIFFVDNEAILKITGDKLMKATYIHDVLFPTVFGINLLECMHPILAYFSSIIWRMVPVFGLAWLFIEIVPIFASWAHGKERDFMFEREESNIEYERKLALKRATLLNAEKKQIDAEAGKVVSERKKRTAVKKLTNEINGDVLQIKKTEQEIWDEEYSEFVNAHKGVLQQLKLFIYTNRGHRSEYGNINALSIFDLYKLVEKLPGLYQGDETYQLTEKGRYFLKNEK